MQSDSQNGGSQAKLWLAAALVLVAGIFAVYGSVGSFDFVNLDDKDYVYDNPHIAEGLSGGGVTWAFTHVHSNNWHPLTWMSHMLDVDLFGISPGEHHWVNVGFHATCALLLLWLCARFGLGLFASMLIAGLFAWHPLRVESVAWISERKDVLSGFFALLCLHAYLSYARRGGALRYALVAITLALGLLAKPMLVTLPVALLLLDLWPLKRFQTETFKKLLLEKAPLLFLALVSGVLTIAVQSQSGAVKSFDAIPLIPRLENAAWSVLVYPAETLFPRGLAVLYPHPALEGGGLLLHGQALFALLVIVVISLWAWKRRAAAPWLLVGWLWYLIMLAPVSGVLQVGEQAHADRYTYLPTIGLFLALGAALNELLQRRPQLARGVQIACTLSLLSFAGLAHRQTSHWRDSEALFRRSIAVTGGNFAAHLNLGMWLLANERLDEALVETRAAVALKPSAPEAHYNLGVQELATGNREAAFASFQETLEQDAHNADAHNRLAKLEFTRNNIAAAASHFEKSAEYAPERFDLQSNLARFRVAVGDLAGARAPFERALELNPDAIPLADQKQLARARAADGDTSGSIQLLRQLRAQQPTDPSLAADLAWILATTDVEALRAPAEALGLAEQLLRAPGAPRAELLAVQAAALAAMGDFQRAVAAQTEAVRLAPKGLGQRGEERLRAYGEGQALRLASPW